MRSKYSSMLPSSDSLMQGGNHENGERQASPQKQEKPDNILRVDNRKSARRADSQQATFYDQKEYERRVKAVVEGRLLATAVQDVDALLSEQKARVSSIPLDVLRNNSNKLVNQDMDVAPLENVNRSVANTLCEVAATIHASKFMSFYNEELTRKDREKWQLSETDKAMMEGADKACKYIEENAGSHLTHIASRMEWFPVAYHLIDKVALVVFPILGYYTGKYHLNDTMTFLWIVAFMPVFVASVIWGINELAAWLERRKKPKSRQ